MTTTKAPQAVLCTLAPRTRRRVQIGNWDPSMTKQEFANDCDINRILAGYQRTGALNHFAKYSPQYGEFNACDLQEAQNLLIRARNMFDALPSALRKEVSTPEGFLDFVQNPANQEKMAAYGLTNPKYQTVPDPKAAPQPSATPSQGA